MSENQSEVGGFDKYINNFLKAEDVVSVEDEYVCVNVTEANFDGKASIRLDLQRSPDKYIFDLNKSNAVFVKNAGLKHPKELIGKKLTFEKVRVFNPSLKKEVDGLRIKSIA